MSHSHFHHHGFEDLQHLLWHEGGCVMLPLFLIAAWIGYLAVDMLIWFHRNQHGRHDAAHLCDCLDDPSHAKGESQAILRYVRASAGSCEDIRNRVREVAGATLPRINGRLQFLGILVSAAPLLGLLGTVFGMLGTFQALGAKGGETLERISHGISEALITTEVGLLIAVPGYIAVYLVQRKRNQFRAFLMHLETLAMQRHQHHEGCEAHDHSHAHA